MSEKIIHNDCNYLKDKEKLKNKNNILKDDQEFLLAEMQNIATQNEYLNAKMEELSGQLTLQNNILISKIEKDEQQDKNLKLTNEQLSELSNYLHENIKNTKMNKDEIDKLFLWLRNIKNDTGHLLNGHKKEQANVTYEKFSPMFLKILDFMQKQNDINQKLLLEKEETKQKKLNIQKEKEKNKGKNKRNWLEILKIIGIILLILAAINGITIPA